MDVQAGRADDGGLNWRILTPFMTHLFAVHDDPTVIAECLVKETCEKKRLRLLNSTK